MENRICPECKVNLRKLAHKTKDGTQKYRRRCYYCANGPTTKRYDPRKKNYCEECGFKAKHGCQLDVDHKDGNHKNKSDRNIQTLCANCHRLKTKLRRESANLNRRPKSLWWRKKRNKRRATQ